MVTNLRAKPTPTDISLGLGRVWHIDFDCDPNPRSKPAPTQNPPLRKTSLSGYLWKSR
ncbi:hypothetical protein [Chroococcidiopsis sp. SAG 2025]|uniref:hypothetical protein n=1 Tax=Chroococcidiopsis sp. SAG 2025 TaxID=171389 RepID=UPI0029371764|nr:hypothetical protein [Chroococcidiopsis sp. SAG 2025]